ncbi:MAG TPA: cation-transporting P-type ATPase, partial [Candidatus Paceibacterota bacterium]
MRTTWHSISLPELFERLRSSEEGLTQKEAEARLKEHGPNVLPEGEGHSVFHLFFSQFNSPLMYIMIAATAISFVLGNTVEAVFIFVVMISNALVGFYQEHKANQSLKMLKGVLRLDARVVRDTREVQIDAREIVPGDI